MLDQLGDWTRTDTCGALRAADIGREVTLLGWVHRVRDLGALVFIDVRDRYGLTQVVVQEGQAFLDTAKHLRAEFVIGVKGVVRPRAAEAVNPRMPTGEVEVAAVEFRVLNDAAGAAVPDRRRSRPRLRRPSAALSVPRPAASGAAGQPRTSAPRLDGRSAVLRRARLLGSRDAGAGQVDARGRARLSRAEPSAPGRVLRAAAVAAAVQAAVDDRGHRPVFPDRQVLPRRGPARGPPAGIHADRRRDVVRPPTAGLRDHRAADAGRVRRHWPRGPAAVRPHAVRRSHRPLRVRQAGPAVRPGDPGSLGPVRRDPVHAVPRRTRRGRRRARLRRAGRSGVQPEAARHVDRAGEAGGRGGPRVGAPRRRA